MQIKAYMSFTTTLNVMIVMMIMNLYSAKTIKEYSKALYIKLN